MFDTLSLANQWHRSKSTYPKGFEGEKSYFLENQVFNLIKPGQKHLFQAIKKNKKAMKKNSIYIKDKLILGIDFLNKK